MARDGHRSWREMLAQNATMTIEHWFGVSIDKHTWAHPWSAGPAALIVRRVFGVRPIEAGYTARPPVHSFLSSPFWARST